MISSAEVKSALEKLTYTPGVAGLVLAQIDDPKLPCAMRDSTEGTEYRYDASGNAVKARVPRKNPVPCVNTCIPIADTFQDIDRSLAVSYAQAGADILKGVSALLSVDPSDNVSRSPNINSKTIKELEENKHKKSESFSAALQDAKIESIRVRTSKYEMIIDTDGKLMLVIVQAESKD